MPGPNVSQSKDQPYNSSNPVTCDYCIKPATYNCRADTNHYPVEKQYNTCTEHTRIPIESNGTLTFYRRPNHPNYNTLDGDVDKTFF